MTTESEKWLNCPMCETPTYVKRWVRTKLYDRQEAWCYCFRCEWKGLLRPESKGAIKIYRAWVNQPSASQPLHHMHGTFCIAVHDRPGNVRLYFTEGPIHSMDANPMCITRADKI
jgi:hypothetical protein